MRREGVQHPGSQPLGGPYALGAAPAAPCQPTGPAQAAVFYPTYYTPAGPSACCYGPVGGPPLLQASDASSSLHMQGHPAPGPPPHTHQQHNHHSGSMWPHYSTLPMHEQANVAGAGPSCASSTAGSWGPHACNNASSSAGSNTYASASQGGGSRAAGAPGRGPQVWSPSTRASPSNSSSPHPSSSNAQQAAYYGYAAVPCIMVPTGEAVFYTHIPTSTGAPHHHHRPGELVAPPSRMQPTLLALPPPAPLSSNAGGGYHHRHQHAAAGPFAYGCMHHAASPSAQIPPRHRKVRAAAAAAAPPAGPQQHQQAPHGPETSAGTPQGTVTGGTSGGVQPTASPSAAFQQYISTGSLSGSRSVSSFSSAGFYAMVDSASEASHDPAARVSSSSSNSRQVPATGQLSQQPSLQASLSAQSSSAAAAVVESTSWGDLTVGILQNIISKLVDAEIKQLRQVCRHWRAAVDHNLDTLTPSSLMSKLITLRFPNLKLLHLTNCNNVRNRDLQLLSMGGLRLHTLTLGDDANRPWVSNIGLAWIGKVTTLTALNLQDCTQVTNKGLLFLQQLTSLSALSLKGCNKVNNMGLEGLRHNTALTSLNLTGCTRVSDKGLLPLTALPSLLCLHLGSTRVKDEGMEYLARITTLHDLHFAREAMTDTGLLQLSTLTNLQTLALRECPQVTGDSLSALVPQLSNLQSLDLFQSYAFDDAQLAKCLDFLGSVTFLDLRGTVVSEEGIQQLARLQNLQKLCLAPPHEVQLEVEQHLCVVSHLTQLTSLAINNCRLVSFDLMASLAHLKLLRELDISNNGQTTLRAAELAAAREPVNDGAIRAMTNITSLTSIDLSRRSVHEEQLNVLAERLPKLRTLFVVGCPVLYETLQALHRRFPELVIHRKPVHDAPAHSCASSEHNFW